MSDVAMAVFDVAMDEEDRTLAMQYLVELGAKVIRPCILHPDGWREILEDVRAEDVPPYIPREE